MSIGVVVGRFQVDDLHPGHRALLDFVSENHAKVVVFIGLDQFIGSKKDPLDFATRSSMLLAYNPSFIVLPLLNQPSDELWSKKLDQHIRNIFPVGSVTLYGSRDSFIPRYNGGFSTCEFASLDSCSGTKVRAEVARKIRSSSDFRAGVIYNETNRFPRTWPVVDIALVRDEGSQRLVLFGQKEGEPQLRFPGGFVDPTDQSFEAAARRELREETGMDVSVDGFEYVGSFPVPDRRCGPGDQIMTLFFLAKYQFGRLSPAKAADDLCAVSWVLVEDLEKITVVPGHEQLRAALVKHLKV